MLRAVAAPQRTLSHTAAAVLGMVGLGAQSGYEILRAAERSVRFFWALGPPQIYAELKRLEQQGLISGRDAARGGRARRLYAITPAGEQALHAWLADPDDIGTLELRDPEMLRVFFADALDTAEALERLDIIRRRSQTALEQFRREILPAAARAADNGAHYPQHVAELGRELHELVIAWSDRLRRRLDGD
jgi:DNA-binding PadR family transcriptional regulator